MSAKSKAALSAAIETERDNQEKALNEFREWLIAQGFKKEHCWHKFEYWRRKKRGESAFHELMFRSDSLACVYRNELNGYNGPLDIEHIKKCVLGYRWHGYYGDSK